MNDKLMELVFILDKSGSMAGLEADTIGGFNSILKKQRESDCDVYVSTITFNHITDIIHDRVRVESVKPITTDDFVASGATALLDAVGRTIDHIRNIHKYAREEDKPAKTLFIIMTDGMENSSHNYSYKDVKSMIEQQQKEFGWEFIFLGANIDVAGESARLGIRQDRMTSWDSDSSGVQDVMCYAKAVAFAFAQDSDDAISQQTNARNEKRKKKSRK